MPHMPENTDSDLWHKYFAMDSNNQAWTLMEKNRSAEENHELLVLAHASFWHWNTIGPELNRMRAKMLLAEAYALTGHGSFSIQLADEILIYFQNRETPDWEIAFVLSVHAHAAYASGNEILHRSSYAKATAALDMIKDPIDRSIVEKTFCQIPIP